jgi:tRNA threonylcarbamoyladenosine biosynthesis protein TsaB
MILALDACTAAGTVALFDGGRIVAAAAAPMRGTTGERLMPAVVGVVESAGASWRAIDRVVVGGGPGSFTALRIAASIAKGLATSLGVELWAVPSLALIVAQAGAAPPAPGRWRAVLDAMRGEYFVLDVDVAADGALTLPARGRRVPVDELAPQDGVTRTGPGGPVDVVAGPHARGAARLLACGIGGPVDLDRWEPDYGRLAEAQVRWEAAHGRALGEAAG